MSASSANGVNERFLANFNCWQKIFEHLNGKQRVLLEEVNTRLFSLTTEMWNLEQAFHLTDVVNSTNTDVEKQSAGISGACARLGQNVRLLNLNVDSSLSANLSDDLKTIAKSCPNIERIDWFFLLSEEEYDYIVPSGVRFDSFTRLKSLRFLRTEIDGPSYCAVALVSIFQSIPSSIEILTNICPYDRFETHEEVERFFFDRPALKEVMLGHLESNDGEKLNIFPIIADRCKQLKRLYLFTQQLSLRGIDLLSDMTQLVTNTICMPPNFEYLTDEEMIAVCSRNPLLDHLAPSDHGRNLRFIGLSAISALRHLQSLDISGVFGGGNVKAGEHDRVIQRLVQNSGHSMSRLWLSEWGLSDRTIEMMANCCPKLRETCFEIWPQAESLNAIRSLIDRTVSSSAWRPSIDYLQLCLIVITPNDDRESTVERFREQLFERALPQDVYILLS